MEQKKWYGERKCCYCNREITTVLYDAPFLGSFTWGVWCHSCWLYNANHKIGQKYKKEGNDFIKVGGKNVGRK